MEPTALTTVEDRLGEYARRVNKAESGIRRDEVEVAIEIGIAAATAIEEVDEAWRIEVFSGLTPFQQDRADELVRFFELWRHLAERTRRVILDFEMTEPTPHRADEFLALHREMTGAATPDAQFFDADHPIMVKMLDQAIDDHRSGRADD